MIFIPQSLKNPTARRVEECLRKHGEMNARQIAYRMRTRTPYISAGIYSLLVRDVIEFEIRYYGKRRERMYRIKRRLLDGSSDPAAVKVLGGDA